MTDIQLTESSDNPAVDRIIRGIVGIFELVFPKKIKAYILTGSYLTKGAVRTSDIDMYIIFERPLSAEEYGAFWGAKTHCDRLSPLDLDLKPFSYPQVMRLGYPNIRDYGQTVFGDDFRSRCEPLSGEAVYLMKFHSLSHMFRIRGNPDSLLFPFSAPDPDAPFLGYTQRPARSFQQHPREGTKALINIASRTAMSIIAEKTRRPVFSKKDCLRVYREKINDQWLPFLRDVELLCRKKWGYLVPKSVEDQKKLRDICRLVLDFENHYLALFRAYLLAELRHEARPNLRLSIPDLVFLLGFNQQDLEYLFQRQAFQFQEWKGEHVIQGPNILKVAAASMFGKVLFRDPRVGNHLAALADDKDSLLRHVARRSQNIMREAGIQVPASSP